MLAPSASLRVHCASESVQGQPVPDSEVNVSVAGNVSVTVVIPDRGPLPTFWTESEYVTPDWPRARLPESVKLAANVAEVAEAPVPLSGICSGTASKPLTRVSCPPSCPISVGAYVTLTVHVP